MAAVFPASRLTNGVYDNIYDDEEDNVAMEGVSNNGRLSFVLTNLYFSNQQSPPEQRRLRLGGS